MRVDMADFGRKRSFCRGAKLRGWANRILLCVGRSFLRSARLHSDCGYGCPFSASDTARLVDEGS